MFVRFWVEIYFSKMGFLDCKWSNLNAPGSYIPWCHSLLGPAVECPSLHAGKGKCCMCLLTKVETYFTKGGHAPLSHYHNSLPQLNKALY